jgi:hypothetical protein
LEIQLVNNGMTQSEAHELATKRFNYAMAIAKER